MVRRIRTSPRMLANATTFWHDVAPFHLAVLAKSAVQLFEHQRREMVTVYDSSLAPPPTDLVGANPVADEMQSKKGGHRQRKRKEKKYSQDVDPEELRLKALAEQSGRAIDQFNLGMFYLSKAKGAEPRYPELASMNSHVQPGGGAHLGESKAAAMSVVKEVRQMQRDNSKLRRKMAKASASESASGSRKLAISAEDVKVTKTHRQGTTWLLRAHEGGHTEATIALANQLVQADSVEPSGADSSRDASRRIFQAIELYKAASPHPDACFNLGKLYYDGIPNHLSMDRFESVRWFQLAAEAGDLASKFFLGHLYRVGEKDRSLAMPAGTTAESIAEDSGETTWIVPIDPERSFELLDDASRGGHSEASMYLCTFFRDGVGDDVSPGFGKPQPERMWEYLRLAEAQGSADAMYMLADLHLYGDRESGLQPDAPLALRYYLDAGEAGPHSEALCSAAAMFFHGLGTNEGISARERLKRAYELYQQAVDADSDNKEAWRNLASCYYHGHGVQKDVKLARYILKTVL